MRAVLPDGLERGIPFNYMEYTLPNRNSVQELEQDSEIRKAFWNIASGDVVVDVGSGFGGYTLCALARGASRVFAFECDGALLEILRENLAKNPAIFALEKCSTCSWRVDSGAHSIDSFFNTLSSAPQKVDWLKIDVDDPLDVLKGARQIIQEYHPNIVIRTTEYDELKNELQKYVHVEGLRGHFLARFQ